MSNLKPQSLTFSKVANLQYVPFLHWLCIQFAHQLHVEAAAHPAKYLFVLGVSKWMERKMCNFTKRAKFFVAVKI